MQGLITFNSRLTGTLASLQAVARRRLVRDRGPFARQRTSERTRSLA